MSTSWCVTIPCLEVRSGKPSGALPGHSQLNLENTMIVGIGVDLIRCSRIERELSNGPWQAAEGVFTTQELRNCGEGKRKAARMAACFTAKEAALKALGAEVEDLGMFREVEVLYGPSREPCIALHGRARSRARRLGVTHIWVSTASAKKHAGALVVLES